MNPFFGFLLLKSLGVKVISLSWSIHLFLSSPSGSLSRCSTVKPPDFQKGHRVFFCFFFDQKSCPSRWCISYKPSTDPLLHSHNKKHISLQVKPALPSVAAQPTPSDPAPAVSVHAQQQVKTLLLDVRSAWTKAQCSSRPGGQSRPGLFTAWTSANAAHAFVACRVFPFAKISR